MKTIVYRSIAFAISLGALSLLPACTIINKTGANLALQFAEKNIVPPLLTLDDVEMACASGHALTPTMTVARSMGADSAKMAVFMYSSAGVCAENKAVEAELRYLRAAKAGQVNEAQDARIEQKRWYALAAKRQYMAYQLFAEHWESRYKFQLGDHCPSMKSDLDKTVYLLGMLSGLQAVTNDISSGGQVNVPKDIAATVERGMKCLDNQAFWGVPNATRASIWRLLPSAAQGNPDIEQTMRDAMAIGEKSGVRMAHALYAISAQTSGDAAQIRRALQAYSESVGADKPVNSKYQLLNAMAANMVQQVADRYWTEHTGVRLADASGYTQFWDTQVNDGLEGIDLSQVQISSEQSSTEDRTVGNKPESANHKQEDASLSPTSTSPNTTLPTPDTIVTPQK